MGYWLWLWAMGHSVPPNWSGSPLKVAHSHEPIAHSLYHAIRTVRRSSRLLHHPRGHGGARAQEPAAGYSSPGADRATIWLSRPRHG